jgi:ubiquinone/menaquinone biosynthesis C-methylase UbiE
VNAVPNRARGQFDGVLQIVRYNWTYYAGAIFGATALVVLVGLLRPPLLVAWVLVLGAIAAIFWLVLSLVVSHYVYDRSDLYRWQWIRDFVLPRGEHGGGGLHIVNIHAGLDETSVALQEMFPASEVTILDVYDADDMPEPSIARARQDARPGLAAVSADFRSLPLADASADLVTVIFVAHELRRGEAKEAFFREVERILKPGGLLLLVEHLRDAWNLCAFGPGAFHFFPRREWLRVTKTAGFELKKEFTRTPFVRAFVFGRPLAPTA